MRLKCLIKGKKYDSIVAGATFSEEYSETLDSGTITIDHIPEIQGLKPYEDVLIWNADEEFYGYHSIGDVIPFAMIGAEAEASASCQSLTEWDDVPASFDAVTGEDSVHTLSGDLIAAWSLIYSGLEENHLRIDYFPVRVTMRSMEDENVTYSAYYTISSSRSDAAQGFSGFLKLTRDESLSANSEAPSVLYVSCVYEIPKANLQVLAPTQDAKMTILPSSVAEDETPWFIEYIEPVGRHDYSFQRSNALPRFSFSVSGDLSADEISHLNSMSMSVVAGMQSFDLRFSGAEKNQNGTVTLWFEQSVPAGMAEGELEQKPFAYLYFIVAKRNGVWSFAAGGKTLFALDDGEGDSQYSELEISAAFDPTDASITETNEWMAPSFYKHMLVDSYTCEMITLDGDCYKYKINLMSETKRLEKTILPNISITQPISGEKRSVWFYLNKFVELYSPKIKVDVGGGHWEYRPKYKIDAREKGDRGGVPRNLGIPVHEIFDDSVYAPEMSLTAPTLREFLSRLMTIKDCIPVVWNDVIYAMRISNTHGTFETSPDHFTFVNKSIGSSDYSTALKREYEGALSQRNSAHMVENLGFRCRDDALMTLDNMTLETRFPIYKINKLWMCYYKKIGIHNTNTGEDYQKIVLIRQDISRLILQNEVRNSLAADWTKIAYGGLNNMTVEEMSRYRFLTLGYEIGSKTISGWGEKFSYISDLFGWIKNTYTYIETIMRCLDDKRPFGDSNLQFLEPGEEVKSGISVSWEDCMITPNKSNNITDGLKTLFFQMDYVAMYSGTLVHAKGNTTDDGLQSSDNCSSSLTVLEVDGVFEREKANRYGNLEVGLQGRFSSVAQMDAFHDFVGTRWDKDPETIIYHREYQIYDDCVLANFSATKDYVMKNYFTTVFARYRTYSYASYRDSVNRGENDKYMVFASEGECIFEYDNESLLNTKSLMSGITETTINDDLTVNDDDQVNGGWFAFDDGNEYYSDVNQFVSGFSLCFNIRLFDTVTNGNYISTLNCYDDGGGYYPGNSNAYIGSAQEWYKMPIKENDAFLGTIGCFFGHFDKTVTTYDGKRWEDEMEEEIFSDLFSLPLKKKEPSFSFGKWYEVCKDDKDLIDFTLQYEYVQNGGDFVVSEWLMKLTDFSEYKKFPVIKKIVEKTSTASNVRVYFGSEWVNWNPALLVSGSDGNTYKRTIRVALSPQIIGDIGEGSEFSGAVNKREYIAAFIKRNQVGSWTARVTTHIQLERITGVTKNGNSISSLSIQAFYQSDDDTQHDGLISGTATLSFSFVGIGDDGYFLFEYKGQDGPGLEWEARLTLNNGNSKEEVYCSVSKHFSYIDFPKTMYVIKSTERITDDVTQAEFRLDSLPDSFSVVDTPGDAAGNSFSDVFSITEDEYGRKALNFGAPAMLGNDYASVQYWYLDAEGDGYMHYVMGVNATRAEGAKKMYLSLVKSRDPRVYGPNHLQAGTVSNLADDPTGHGAQTYDAFEEE